MILFLRTKFIPLNIEIKYTKYFDFYDIRK